MIGLSSIVKLAKGNLTIDDIGEMFSALGMEVEFRQLEISEASHAFRHAALAAAKPDARLMKVSGTDKEGCQFEGLMILVPSSRDAQRELPKSGDRILTAAV